MVFNLEKKFIFRIVNILINWNSINLVIYNFFYQYIIYFLIWIN